MFCYINQIEKSGFVFSNPICVQDFALRSWFSCSFLLSFSPDYWLQRLEQETCFGSPDIRAAKPAEGIYVTYSLIGKKKKANQIDYHLPQTVPSSQHQFAG